MGSVVCSLKIVNPFQTKTVRDMENTWYLPSWRSVWEFLIAFSEAACRRKIPLQSKRVGGLAVNTWTCKHVHVNLRCSVCPHQADIKAGWKELTCSRADQLLRFQLQISLLMSVPKLVRPRRTRKCAELKGGVQVGPPQTQPSKEARTKELRWKPKDCRKMFLFYFTREI